MPNHTHLIVVPEFLIPFKARAWLDLTKRKKSGENIDSREIKKHRNDVFRLFAVIYPGDKIDISASIKSDLNESLTEIEKDIDDTFNIKSFGSRVIKINQLMTELKTYYGVND